MVSFLHEAAHLTSTSFIRLTNDGHAILREIDVAHPAAKSMIELSRTQDEEVGDGTTSVIILGEFCALTRSLVRLLNRDDPLGSFLQPERFSPTRYLCSSAISTPSSSSRPFRASSTRL